MIKINLLKDSGGGGGGSVTQGTGITIASSGPVSIDVKDLVIKFVLILAPIAALQIFSSMEGSQQAEELQKLRTEAAKVDTELKSLDSQVKEVEKFTEEKRQLDSQMDTIRNLSKERLKNVKSLNEIQSIIPEKAWLVALRIKETAVELDGQAVDDIVISDFMRSLEDSRFFANVTLASSEESRLADGSVKKFLIKCNLESF